MDFGSREYWPDGTTVEKPNNITSDRTFLRDLSPGSTNKVWFTAKLKMSIYNLHSMFCIS